MSSEGFASGMAYRSTAGTTMQGALADGAARGSRSIDALTRRAADLSRKRER
jgi:hypothetical protein